MARDRELFLIDGNSLAYRAFFALPDTFATSEGFPTNAIFGFASMLVKILTEYGPKATIVAWDAGMSGREEEYEPYKAEREPRPDLLGEQWPHLEELVEALGYRNEQVEGYEADDVIATLAQHARDAGIKVMVVTGDRDAYQLADNGNVRIMTTARGITDTRIYDRDGVIERYGIPPEAVPDFIGLKGDTSDNIPGVPGIGDKTAAQLLDQYGSLEDVLAHIDEISGEKRRENLRANADVARLSKDLATLKRDLPVAIDVSEVVKESPDRSRLREFFQQFELREPLRRLEQALGPDALRADSPPDPAGGNRPEATARDAASADLAELPEGSAALCVQREGEGVSWAAYGGNEVLVGTSESLPALVAAWGERPVEAHDWKSISREAGPELGEPDDAEVRVAPAVLGHDTMVAAYLLDPARRRYPLRELAEEAGIETSAQGAGGLADEAATVRALAEVQRREIERRGLAQLLDEVELPLVGVLCSLERAGVKLDTYKLGETAAGVAEQIEELEQEIQGLAGEQFTVGSPQQLSRILFDELGLTRKRRGKTGFSTDARVLRAIRDEHPIVAKVESWRELSKLKSTYFDALPSLISEQTARLHTTFNQTGTATGRLSSANPNLQNIPVRTPLGQKIRSCFVAEEGARLVSGDYSQVELRILADVADEGALKEIFARGEDVHAATAAEVLKLPPEKVGPAERSRAKAVNFGIVYGLSPHGLSEQLEIPYEEAAAYIEDYLNRFPAVQAFIERTVSEVARDGHATTLLGRMRAIPELHADRPQTRALGERLAVNTVLQGTAADIMKVAMVRCHRRLRRTGLATKLVLTIHDELLFEVPEQEVDEVREMVRMEMEGAYELDPPLKVGVGVGNNWLEAK